jgi:hypothetical protein
MRAVTRTTRTTVRAIARRASIATTARAADAPATIGGNRDDPRQHANGATARRAGTRDRWFAAEKSEEMPMRAIADAIGDAFGPALDAIAEEQRRRGEARRDGGETEDETEAGLYVPDIPAFLCATRLARDSPMVRSVLVVDERAPRTKPRLSWYDVDDEGWAPRGWWEDGVKADFAYYFGERRESSTR